MRLGRLGRWLFGRPAGWRWSPRRLGRSLPIHRRLWISRGVAAAITLAATLGAWGLAREALSPEGGSPLAADAVEKLVAERLAAVKIPPWDPGAPLPETEPPPFEAPPPPPLWGTDLPGDAPSGAARQLAAEGRLAFREELHAQAANALLRAAERQPSSWRLHYEAGLALLGAQDYGRAARSLERAGERLPARAAAGSAGYQAARVATFYAAGHAHLPNDCVAALWNFKNAVGGLGGFVRAARPVYGRELPFAVDPAGFDSNAVWSALAWGYLECEGRYPGQYYRAYPQAGRWADGEYTDASAEEVVNGPFPARLTECIEAGEGKRPAECWAYSNLNRVYMAARSLLREDADPARTVGKDLLPGLARLAYNVAWLAAGSAEDRGRAALPLAQAARLDRAAVSPELDGRIAALGRYLAPYTRNYVALAEPWSRADPRTIPLTGQTPLEDLKGIAWLLSERWQGQLAEGRAAGLLAEIDEQAHRAGPYGKSLQEWRAEVQEGLRDALARALREERRNGNLAAAVALRRYRAPYLGDAWPRRAARAWISPSTIAYWALLFLLWLAAVAAAWLVHRLVVFPYLLYTTDTYRSEFQRRHAELRRHHHPFTRDEILEAERRRG